MFVFENKFPLASTVRKKNMRSLVECHYVRMVINLNAHMSNWQSRTFKSMNFIDSREHLHKVNAAKSMITERTKHQRHSIHLCSSECRKSTLSPAATHHILMEETFEIIISVTM